MKKIEYINLKVSVKKAPLLLKLIELAHEQTKKAINCPITTRDWKIHKAIEEHYDMESFLIHDIKKELK
jgi:hypothetical protein